MVQLPRRSWPGSASVAWFKSLRTRAKVVIASGKKTPPVSSGFGRGPVTLSASGLCRVIPYVSGLCWAILYVSGMRWAILYVSGMCWGILYVSRMCWAILYASGLRWAFCKGPGKVAHSRRGWVSPACGLRAVAV